ncbi:Dam family site-specific DNA-(adenine-N6)-methyltransferase [Campylobacter lari]|uniref:Dam family site-specific DNA-(adenine-N6)-methyltransferase n=1 Tax=Campylobacter lari TaxID=201 RepID=UPI00126E8BED|nr:Dam family site-specific DNA-(adenine-N6)-methyltransferase [Campylobacter lari]EAJ0339778.1 Dam family site-specific DNA-(adenine-N6)-methyltransferase [Campylobacter lari]EAJ5700906.1 Dam family site-specific DNA-(adenine-N6)-methyltransferase [Campylobacter lari]EAK9938011.1 Dam family site-specific DNA-(adenine-N6)-methyltransferase [Campylobacter lari]EHS0799930.1 Dam family site-specific DNA-(adenine-N6)-methyltransferase [Campylobacter lari]EMC9372786.1 Dam family site-specific DNA-(
MKITRSPLFYVGDKYKLMGQLKKLFPETINKFIEPFVGGGSVFLNTKANEYLVNDIDTNVINLHKTLSKFDIDTLLNELSKIVHNYGLSFSFKGITVPDNLKRQYIKTYYAKYNKLAYEKLRKDFNNDKNNILYLYILLIYGFNRIIRFNSKGNFNLPVGNVDFNINVYNALKNYISFMQKNKIHFENNDYINFINKIHFENNDYVYLDPPYLISNSEYNKFWNISNEIALYKLLDELNLKNIKFGITNLIHHKGQTNEILKNWSQKYKIFNINSNYISFNDNTIKTDSKEIFVTNYNGVFYG